MQSWTEDHLFLTLLAKEIDKSIVLVTKDGWFWKMLGSILQFFRMMSKEEFLEDYATTIGPIQAYPREWDTNTVDCILYHEARHTRQARWFGLGISPWVGLPFMAVVYGLLFFPVFLAWPRYRLELDACKTQWIACLKNGYKLENVASMAIEDARQISSSSYGWAVPYRWARWGYMRALGKVFATEFRRRARLATD
jgi:hypothetical protein